MQTLIEISLYAIFVGPVVALAISLLSIVAYVLVGFEKEKQS